MEHLLWPVSVRHIHVSHLILNIPERNYLYFTNLKTGVQKFFDGKNI